MADRFALHIAGAATVADGGPASPLLGVPDGGLAVTVGGEPDPAVTISNRTGAALTLVEAAGGAAQRLEPGDTVRPLTVGPAGAVLAIQAASTGGGPCRTFSLVVTAEASTAGIAFLGQLIAAELE
jgi:hypothetical protein